ncbi:hypothetical protein R3P38DRAFT_2792224 [Favolaschia claudopus]|uniref:Uncharacterized protein n=1 Tax=Favolaschia claudopus TaxID=2862362 RepID=A0AAW0AFL3_9AGAR
MSLAASRLTEPRDDDRPCLATDRIGEDYGLTRDRTMMNRVRSLERYSYKDLRKSDYDNRSSWSSRLIRMAMGRYRGSLIGGISGYTKTYHDNPFLEETRGSSCLCATICCPVGTDEATVELYNRTVATLNDLIKDDLETEPGVVERSWVKQGDNGADLIEVMQRQASRNQDDFRLFIDLSVGCDADILVSLTKDQYRDSTGTLVKSYILWLRDHQILTDEEVGRVTRQVEQGLDQKNDLEYEVSSDEVRRQLAVCQLSAMSTTANDTWLHRFLPIARIMRAKSLSMDEHRVHYGSIRQKTLSSNSERYAYMDFRRSEARVFEGVASRTVQSFYRPWLAGKLVQIDRTVAEHPQHIASQARAATVLHISAPPDPDDHPSQYFFKHIRALKEIMDYDGRNTKAQADKTTAWIDATAQTIQVRHPPNMMTY